VNRWLVGAVAPALAIVLVVTGVAAVPDGGAAVALEGGLVGPVLLVASLWRWPRLLAPALLLVAVPWGIALVDRELPVESVLVGAGLLVVGELAGWSQDLATVVPQSAADAVRLALRTLAMAAAGAATAAILLVASALPAPGSLLRLLAGLGASLAIVAFVAVRRWEPA
jgi:hypothetical protein